jgi:hypothetical protein
MRQLRIVVSLNDGGWPFYWKNATDAVAVTMQRGCVVGTFVSVGAPSGSSFNASKKLRRECAQHIPSDQQRGYIFRVGENQTRTPRGYRLRCGSCPRRPGTRRNWQIRALSKTGDSGSCRNVPECIGLRRQSVSPLCNAYYVGSSGYVQRRCFRLGDARRQILAKTPKLCPRKYAYPTSKKPSVRGQPRGDCLSCFEA